MTLRKDIVTSIIAIVVLTLALGLAYPLLVTGIAQLAWPNKADGSRVEHNGKLVGSRLIGQDFRQPVLGRNGKPKKDTDGNPILVPNPNYFQSRPSATGYSANVTYFNNLGPNNADLSDLIKTQLDAYLKLERPFTPGLSAADVPVDAVTTSASGVDPHISRANARVQANRVARVRGIPRTRVLELIDQYTDGRFAGFLGEPGVNVLELNLALDKEAATR